MAQQNEPTNDDYPRGRGYGHDYMRGGEVFGGYGYSEREEYERRRGELGRGELSVNDAEEPRGRPDGATSRTPDASA